MLRARLSNGLFVFGLDAENIRRLKNNQPILVSLAELGGTDDVMIMAGETLADVQKQLEVAIGHESPQPTSYDQLRNVQ